MNRGILTLVAIACLGLAAPAAAGSLFRCDAPDGTRSYSSTKVPGASCSAMDAGASSGGGGSTSSAAASGPRRVSGQVYAYVENGVRHYSSTRPRGGSASALETIRYSYMETCYACAARPGVDFARVRLNTTAFDKEIASAASRYGVDEAIVRAIIHAESSFNPKARSRVGAQGLMQLMPATAQRFGVEDAYEPEQNIRGGVQYLAWLLKRFDGDLTLAAAGYNAGEGAVAKYKGVPPYAETRRYVERVGVLADRYRGLLAAR
ncbi:lytic transglycosylase domain-containing protein [Cognatiluteimonas lumbrici]|uniref:lytic transglycosylase domain-containing protein n=1 Tax=Cognatiluteimonas lumbrici TaxID=2559601 RepID=UPI00112CD8A5|nr:lytic transglycosylase domain-containing protein [Luteimonas lumbrici]